MQLLYSDGKKATFLGLSTLECNAKAGSADERQLSREQNYE